MVQFLRFTVPYSNHFAFSAVRERYGHSCSNGYACNTWSRLHVVLCSRSSCLATRRDVHCHWPEQNRVCKQFVHRPGVSENTLHSNNESSYLLHHTYLNFIILNACQSVIVFISCLYTDTIWTGHHSSRY